MDFKTLTVFTPLLPLHAKRILVTAPRLYAARLSEKIIGQGGLPIIMPTIETCRLETTPDLDRALHNLSTFDWIAFTSRTGIDAVWHRAQQLGIPPEMIQHSKICAIGKDADRLRELGLRVDLVPLDPSPAGIVAELATVPGIEAQRILVPAPEVKGVPEPNVMPNFVADLGQLGLAVTQVPAYITQSLDAGFYGVELGLIRHGMVDAIAFTSTAEVSALLQMIDAQTIMRQCAIACFGPYTATNAQQLGLSVDVVAIDYSSFAGFVAAISQFFQDGPDSIILP